MYKEKEIVVEVVNNIPEEDLQFIAQGYQDDFCDAQFELLGTGTSGAVYGYKDYAIKVPIHVSDNLMCDIETMMDLEELDFIPNVYAIFDCGKGFVMDRVHGATVSKYLNRTKGNPFLIDESSIDEFETMLLAIMSKGYSPYDLHQGNVMIDNNGKLKIIDVGAFEFSAYPLEDYQMDSAYQDAKFFISLSLRDYFEFGEVSEF